MSTSGALVTVLPAGSNENVQYNDNGVFAGAPDFNYDKVTSAVTTKNNTLDDGVGSASFVGEVEVHGTFIADLIALLQGAVHVGDNGANANIILIATDGSQPGSIQAAPGVIYLESLDSEAALALYAQGEGIACKVQNNDNANIALLVNSLTGQAAALQKWQVNNVDSASLDLGGDSSAPRLKVATTATTGTPAQFTPTDTVAFTPSANEDKWLYAPIGASVSGTVLIEMSLDGGATWSTIDTPAVAAGTDFPFQIYVRAGVQLRFTQQSGTITYGQATTY